MPHLQSVSISLDFDHPYSCTGFQHLFCVFISFTTVSVKFCAILGQYLFVPELLKIAWHCPFKACTLILYCWTVVYCHYSIIVEFIDDKDDRPLWHGIASAMAMFIVAVIQTIILQQYFTRVMIAGLRVRSAVSGAVYRKVCLQRTIYRIVNKNVTETKRLANIYSRATSLGADSGF